jgi:hypothetical protein
MPTWITPRRLRATTALYAVFVVGWFLGQPLPGVGCRPLEPTVTAAGAQTFTEPGEVSNRIFLSVRTLATTEIIPTDGIVPCEPWTAHSRLVAWVTGDWR